MSSSTFETSKLLAAIGSLLLFLSFISYIGLVGLILLFIGLKGLSEHYRDDSMYQHTIKGLIFGFIAILISSVGGAGVGLLTAATTFNLAGFIGGIIGLIVILIISFVFYLIMAINFRKAFNSLADRTGEHMFRTVGTLLYFGAILTIIFVGSLLIWIAWLLATIAFFSMKPSSPQPAYSYTPPPSAQPPPMAPTANTGTQYCPHCGAPVSQGAAFCSHCGKQI